MRRLLRRLWPGVVADRSKAALITRAVERELRRGVAARDAESLARTGPDPELAGLAEHAVSLLTDRRSRSRGARSGG